MTPAPAPARPWLIYTLTAAAVGAAAAAGSLPVDPDSDWYRGVAKPRWQPPPRAFGGAWAPLYASIAWAGGRALGRARGRPRNALAASLGVNLVLNATWTWMFFGLHSPRAGLAGTVLLDISNVELIRRVARTDPHAAAALAPYVLWCGFATALNASIARRNRV
jgi:benzodiazapine receptor